VDGPKEMHLHGSLGDAHDLRYFGQLHLVDKPEQKYGSLLGGQDLRRRPEVSKLLLYDCVRFGRKLPIHQNAAVLRCVYDWSAPPELEPTIPEEIANDIDRDVRQPRFHARVAAKAVPCLIRLAETILREALGLVHISNGRQYEPENSLPIVLNDLVEIGNRRSGVVYVGHEQFGRGIRLHLPE
jgi:hypothetical protein